MRQAVVIIHGIGEQRPMQTLRSFVAGVLGLTELKLKDHAFSKPDRISDMLELRRLSVPEGCGGDHVLGKDCETDFYELYWQHLMQGTGWRPVLEWLLYWLCHPKKLNERSLRIWKRVAAVAVAAVIVATVVLAIAWPALQLWAVGLAISVPLVLVFAGTLAWMLFKWIVFGQLERLVLGFIGDAFRYLNPDPPNVGARRAIRTAGLTLLRGLHEDELRRYERIVLVGHSLGSVIAYDLITWFWQEQHHRVELKRSPGEWKTSSTRQIKTGPVPDDKSPLEELRHPLPDIGSFRDRQWKLWQEHREKGLPWLITDLVTMGSPLAHADVLLADGKCNLEIGTCQREFPTCPPALEDKRDDGLLWREYGEGAHQRKVRILHHGAPFAVTRWTNLYFSGDVIGGPVSHLLGRGIKDVPLDHGETAGRWRSHTRYWDSREKEACRQLRAVLRWPTPDQLGARRPEGE